MSVTLCAISGPLQGALFRLGNEEVTIGRHATNQLCIGDPSVSRRHCVIRPEAGTYLLKDLESNNGTTVNGNPVQECLLKNGDRIGIGSTLLDFVVGDSQPEADIALSVEDNDLVALSTVQLRHEDLPQAHMLDGGITDRLSRELAVLASIGAIVASPPPVERIELELLEWIAGIVPGEQGAILAPGAGEQGVCGWSRQGGPCSEVRVSRNIVDQVFRDGTSILSNDLASNQPQGESMRNVASVMAIPLTARGRIQGVLYLDTTDSKQPFTQQHLEFVTAISSYVALALANSQRLDSLETENRRLREEFQIQHQMIGQSPSMREVYRRIARIAPTDATVLIRGETGTGKELAARAIHGNSPRAERPFEAINCALLKETLLESELFGHEKGAFTGAVAQKRGKFELADGGTVFLDEIAELPEGPQSMLLRVLQERVFMRLGGTKKIKANIRVIAATNKDLEEAILQRRFREDLYYRLNVVSLSMPPLRERPDDIPPLARHFLNQASEENKRLVHGISPEALLRLQSYPWPGNVRELENALKYAVVFGGADEVMPEDLPEKVLEKAPAQDAPGSSGSNYQDAVREAKKQIVMDALRQAGGCYIEAAKLLRVHPNNLHRLIRDLDLKSRAMEFRSER